MKRDVIQCLKHNPQSNFLQNFGKMIHQNCHKSGPWSYTTAHLIVCLMFLISSSYHCTVYSDANVVSVSIRVRIYILVNWKMKYSHILYFQGFPRNFYKSLFNQPFYRVRNVFSGMMLTIYMVQIKYPYHQIVSF